MDQIRMRVGTRKSALAMWQTNHFIDLFQAMYPHIQIEIVPIHTKGDKQLDAALSTFQGKGVFVEEFEQALLSKEIDVAIHSAKDMPMDMPSQLWIPAVLEREEANDIFVSKKGTTIQTVGTGSSRRVFQLKHIYPYIQTQDIRGNVPTRIQKMRDGLVDGLILAKAGLKRLDLLHEEDLHYQEFSLDEFLPAGGQGIIAVQARINDEYANLVSKLTHQETQYVFETERAVMHQLDAGCHAPLGVYAYIDKNDIVLHIRYEGKESIHRAPIEERFQLVDQCIKEIRG